MSGWVGGWEVSTHMLLVFMTSPPPSFYSLRAYNPPPPPPPHTHTLPLTPWTPVYLSMVNIGAAVIFSNSSFEAVLTTCIFSLIFKVYSVVKCEAPVCVYTAVMSVPGAAPCSYLSYCEHRPAAENLLYQRPPLLDLP